jgi:hypothetical protein
MKLFSYRRRVMRVAIVHIGYGPDDRDPFAQPQPYVSFLLRRSRRPQTVLVQLGDGMPTCRTAKSKGCPIVVQQSEEDA